MEGYDVVLTEGTFNSSYISIIATFSISTAVSSNDPEENTWVFFRAKNLFLRLISNLFFLLFLLIFLRCFSLILRTGQGTGSTMVKDGECLTRAWCLSIDIEKLARFGGCLDVSYSIEPPILQLDVSKKNYPRCHEVVYLSLSATNNHLMKVNFSYTSMGGAKFVE